MGDAHRGPVANKAKRSEPYQACRQPPAPTRNVQACLILLDIRAHTGEETTRMGAWGKGGGIFAPTDLGFLWSK
jgi:hypothetical protein